MKSAKRLTLKQYSLICPVLGILSGGFGIWCFHSAEDMRTGLEFNAQMGMFGILGAVELFRCGMSYLIFWLFREIGKTCLCNGLSMLCNSILGLTVWKIHTEKAFRFQEKCNWFWLILLMLCAVLPELRDGITEHTLKRMLFCLTDGIILNIIPIQFIRICREEQKILKQEGESI